MPEQPYTKRSGPISTGTIKIDCSGMQPGDICGLGMLEIRGVYSRYQGSQTYNNDGRGCCKATVNNITSNILYFRLEMNFITNRQDSSGEMTTGTGSNSVRK